MMTHFLSSFHILHKIKPARFVRPSIIKFFPPATWIHRMGGLCYTDLIINFIVIYLARSPIVNLNVKTTSGDRAFVTNCYVNDETKELLLRKKLQPIIVVNVHFFVFSFE